MHSGINEAKINTYTPDVGYPTFSLNTSSGTQAQLQVKAFVLQKPTIYVRTSDTPTYRSHRRIVKTPHRQARSFGML